MIISSDRPDEGDEEYEARIRGRAQAVFRDRPESLQAFLHQMRGAPPEKVLALFPDAGRLRREPPVPSSIGEIDSHPLDYSWLFTEACSHQLSSLLDVPGHVLLVGSPSLALRLLASAPLRDWTLVDKSPVAGFKVPTERFTQVDLCAERPRLRPADLVFMDPPWYPELIRSWIAFAVANVRPRGEIWTTVWPELTRSAARGELQALLSELSSLGQVEREENAVAYACPVFEQRARESRGVIGVRDWRMGDLLRIRVERPDGFPPPWPLRAIRRWRRYCVGDRQIALLDRRPEGGRPALYPLSNGAWRLSSVSRRDPLREEVEIWSSSGVVARLSAFTSFKRALQNDVGGRDPDGVDVREARRLLELIGFVDPDAVSSPRCSEEWFDTEWRSVERWLKEEDSG